MHFFKSKKTNLLPLYNKIAFLTRENFFYKDFKLLDSFSNRIYLIFFHLCFILIALKNKENDKNSVISLREIAQNKVILNDLKNEIIKSFQNNLNLLDEHEDDLKKK